MACRALYHCNYCQRDISDNIRIKCATCADFDLCVECFSVGVEIMGHTNDHTYKVMDNLSFPIFHPNWGVSRQLRVVCFPSLCRPLSMRMLGDMYTGCRCTAVWAVEPPAQHV